MLKKLVKAEDIYEVAWVKRTMEYETLIPGFHEEAANDTNGTLKKYGIPLKEEAVSYYPPILEDGLVKMRPVYQDPAALKYAEFMDNKYHMREELKILNVPTNKAMKKWRDRQIGRCAMELGAKYQALVQANFAIEMSEGCSVGCEFCGLNAGRLKSVFRYNEENSRLFKDVLRAGKDIIGDSAGYSTLYFASEPLDNPDYELFLKDYREVFNTLPQITTATATRNIDRLRGLLKELNEDGTMVYRFSLTSLEATKKIFEEFTPEELVLVELLPQYEEAPGCSLVDVGRKGEKDGEYEDTISCISGFVLNMCTHKIRLTTPTWASKEHPTGEYILDEDVFEDGEDLRRILNEMIKKHMPEIIKPKERLRLRKGLTLKERENDILICAPKGTEYRVLIDQRSNEAYKEMIKCVSEEFRTKREICKEFLERTGSQGGGFEMVYFIINKLWAMGILETESGII
ncbi:MAG: radical SAM family RiPP maturation amino acid epimerase [Lachnospiraceae bacterium]|nr:radical SAM family RiPP maturation amino acid epimerase [Lachnospiraceae bacterium]